MNSISSFCPTISGCWGLGATGKSYNAARFFQIATASKGSNDITIFTEEGDKVTISYDHQTQASYANLKALSYQGGFATCENLAVAEEIITRIQGERFWFENSQNLTISVDGDLNEQELNDIKKAIMGIDKIMNELLHGGDISKAMIKTDKIRNLETISGLEADYKYERALFIEQIAVKEVTTYSEYGLAEEPAPTNNKDKWDSLMKLIDRMAKIVEDSKMKPSKFFEPIKRLFVNISQELKEDKPGNKVKKHMADLIELELIKRIEQLAEKENSNVSFSSAFI